MTRFYPASNRKESATSSSSSLLSSVSAKAAVAAAEEAAGTGDFKDVAFSTAPPPHKWDEGATQQDPTCRVGMRKTSETMT